MSIIIPVIFIFLSMLIQIFLQLTPGVFTIFYHSALANFSREKADDLSLAFILGQEIFTAIIFLATFQIAAFSFQDPNTFTKILPWILVGVFMAEAIAISCCYFRHGTKNQKTTKLFISHKSATNLTLHSKNIKNRSDAIALGFITSALEIPFTLPLYIIMSLSIVNFTFISSNLIIILFIIVATLPLFFIRGLFRFHHHLPEIQRLRLKYKPLVRIVLPFAYFLIAILIIIKEL